MTSMDFAPNTGRIPVEHPVEAPNEGAFLVDEIERLEAQFARPAYKKGIDQTRVHYRESDGPNDITFLLGSCTNGEETFEQLETLFGERATIRVVDYPRTFFDINETKDALMRNNVRYEDANRNKTKILVTHSIGTPVADTIMLDPQARRQIGTIDRWGRDSGFTHWDQLRQKVQKAIEFGDKHANNPLIPLLYSAGALGAAIKNGITHSERLGPHLPRKHLRSSALMGWQTRRSHFPIIRNLNFTDNALVAAGQQINEFYSLTTAYDDVINTDVAATEVQRIYGKPSMVLANMALSNEHAVFMEHPELMMAMIDGVFSESYHAGVPRYEITPDASTIRHTKLTARDVWSSLRNLLD